MPGRPTPARSKLRSQRALSAALRRLRARGQRVVLTSGCYDLLHVGHLRGFEEARRQGDVLVVGVNRDARVRQLKGRGRPLVPERQRAELIAGLAAVDYVVLFGEDHAGPLIRRLAPDVFCKGSEYRRGEITEQPALDAVGARLHYLRLIPGIRTTSLLARARRV
jgi:D-beta-D-heptose 7-phosphate kinase/D-beta-D-heptose 1-phosphate adenosyltransferase